MGVWSPSKYGWGTVFWLRVEGVPFVWIERETTQTLPTGCTQDASLVIDRSSEVGQLVDRNTGLGSGFPLTFHLLDTVASRSWLKRWAYSADLNADASQSAVTLNVTSAQNWPAPGTPQPLWLGIERITYGGTTVVAGVTTQFTGCTRGTAGSLSTAHYAGTLGGQCTDLPRWWRGRQVRLFASPVDPSGYMTGSTLESECEEVWRGHLDDGPNRVGNLWEFGALSLDRLLSRPLVAPVVGKIVGTGKYPIKSADTFHLFLAGYDGLTAAAAMTWGFNISIYPYAALADNTVLTPDEQAGYIKAAWATAILPATAAPNMVGGAFNANTYIGDVVVYPQPVDVKKGANFSSVEYYKGSWTFTVRLLTAAGTLRVECARAVNGSQVGGPMSGIIWAAPYSNNGVQSLLLHSAGHLLTDVKTTSAPPAALAGITVQMDAGADAVPTSGKLLVQGIPAISYSAADVTTPGVAHFTGITGYSADPAKLMGKSVEVGFLETGSFADVMRRLLVSSGTALNRHSVYDTLGYGQGYSLDANTTAADNRAAVDPDSFAKLATGALVDLQANVSGAGQSFADIFGGVCALANRAIVARVDSGTTAGGAVGLRRVRLGMVETDPGGSHYTVTITNLDLLTGDGEPVQTVRRRDVLNTITVQLVQGSDEGDKYIVRDGPAVAEQGAIEATFSLPVQNKTITTAIEQWTLSRFAAAQTLQAIEVQCVPWVGDVEVGDVVRLDLTHYAIWQWTTGTPGYTGQGRVLGVRRRLADGAMTLTILIDGATSMRSLSPAAQVSAFAGPAAAPTTIDLPNQYHAHMVQALTDAGADIRLDHYTPGGGAEAGGGFYTISAAALVDVAGTSYCRLTRATVGGGAVLSTASASPSTLTLPATANASTYQGLFAHTLDGSSWV